MPAEAGSRLPEITPLWLLYEKVGRAAILSPHKCPALWFRPYLVAICT